MKVTGPVKKAFTRTVKGNDYFSLCVGSAAEDGSDLWVSFGRTRPAAEENDIVEFEAEKDGKYWQGKAADVKKVSSGGPTAVAGKGGGGWNDPNRQKSIVAQSAFKMSMDFVSIALQNGALSLGTKTAKAPDMWEALSGAVAEKAKEFYFVSLDPDTFFGEEPEDEDEEDEFNPVGD
jgi:hypothetical protein